MVWAVSLALLVLVSGQGVTLTARNTGYYNQGGNYTAGSTSYRVGWYQSPGPLVENRNFVVFDLATVNETIGSAHIEFSNPVTRDLQDNFYTLRSVSTPIPTLVAGGTGRIAIFNDLNTGTIYAETIASSLNPFTSNLNSAGVLALNSVRGRGMIAFGGKLWGTGARQQLLFDVTMGLPVRLVLRPAPSPSPSSSPSHTASSSSSQSSSVSQTRTVTPSQSASPSPRSVTPSSSRSSSITASVTATRSITPTVTRTPTPSISASNSRTATGTPSVTRTVTPSSSVTSSVTSTRSRTASITATPTPSQTASSTGSASTSLSASRTSSQTSSPSASPGVNAVLVLGQTASHVRSYLSFEEDRACRSFFATLSRETNCTMNPWSCSGAPFFIEFDQDDQCVLPVSLLRALSDFHQVIVGTVDTEAACRGTNTSGAMCFDASSLNVVLHHDSVEACLSDFERIVVLNALVGQYCRTQRVVVVTRAPQPPNGTGKIKSVTDLAYGNLTIARSKTDAVV